MTQPPYAPPPYGPPGRKGLPPVAIVLLTLGAVLVLAVAAALVYAVTRPQPIAVTGSVTIKSNIDGGKTCQGTGGFEDIRAGTSVVIHDSAGKIVATGQLDEGAGSDLATSQIALTCRFPFSVQDVPRQKFYGVEVSHRGIVRFSAEQVADGPVALSLGS
jgi:hypothetical protein